MIFILDFVISGCLLILFLWAVIVMGVCAVELIKMMIEDLF